MKKAALLILLIAAIALSYMLGRHQARPAAGATAARTVLYYVDPMHPSYKSDKPGIAPDCGMELVPVYADGQGQATAASDSAPLSPGAVSLDLEKQQLIGVRLATVEPGGGSRTVRLLGRVAADETRVYRVNSGVEGWIQETFNDSVGTQVKKDQKLATYYSRELWSAEQSYLSGIYGGSATVRDSPLGVQDACRPPAQPRRKRHPA